MACRLLIGELDVSSDARLSSRGPAVTGRQAILPPRQARFTYLSIAKFQRLAKPACRPSLLTPGGLPIFVSGPSRPIPPEKIERFVADRDLASRPASIKYFSRSGRLFPIVFFIFLLKQRYIFFPNRSSEHRRRPPKKRKKMDVRGRCVWRQTPCTKIINGGLSPTSC